jgi:hypothetical protein
MVATSAHDFVVRPFPHAIEPDPIQPAARRVAQA